MSTPNEHPSVDELLKKATDYISQTQPELDKFSKQAEDIRKQAERTVGVLVDRGIVVRDKSDAFVNKVANDPAYALRMCEKLAGMMEVDNMGDTASEDEVMPTKRASANIDPYEAAFAPDLIGRGGSNQQL